MSALSIMWHKITGRCRLCGKPLSKRAARTDDLVFNGSHPACYIKVSYGLGVKLDGPGNFDMSDPTQAELRRIRDWVRMAEHDALDARKPSQ